MLPVTLNSRFRITKLQAKRLANVLVKLLVIAIVGIIYTNIIRSTGFWLPCIFRTVTGLKCPGCGISHMCIALLAMDFTSAWLANPVLLAISPAIIYIAMKQIIAWIVFGEQKMSKIDTIIVNVLAVALILWGIVRNMVGM